MTPVFVDRLDVVACDNAGGPDYRKQILDMTFLEALSESAVTFVRDLAAYGWQISGPGWEAISPSGEIKAFTTQAAAQAWRVAECLAVAR